jgi:hypothetical protein
MALPRWTSGPGPIPFAQFLLVLPPSGAENPAITRRVTAERSRAERGGTGLPSRAPAVASVVEIYLDRWRTYAKATEEANRLVAEVQALADALRDWKRVKPSHGGPAAVRTGVSQPTRTLDVDRLPDLARVAATLDAWHDANAALGDAWKQVPEDQKQGLQPPPS